MRIPTGRLLPFCVSFAYLSYMVINGCQNDVRHPAATSSAMLKEGIIIAKLGTVLISQ